MDGFTALVDTENITLSVLGDLITAAIGGTLLLFAQYAISSYRERRERAVLDLTGEYVTYFYDTQNGQRVRSSAKAVLRQKGRLVTGETTLLEHVPGKERSWVIKAEIMKDGNILGHYVCTTPYQTGMGSFSLRANTKEHLLGHWSGYDSDNNTMNYGEYEFKRSAAIEIVEAEPDHESAIYRIASVTLGNGYLPRLDELGARPGSLLLVALAADSGRVLGFVSAELIPKGAFRDEVPRFPTGYSNPALRHADRDGTIGVVRDMGVDPASQGKGIGLRLTEQACASLLRRGAKVLVAGAWKYIGPSGQTVLNVSSVLEANAFQKVCEVEGYWQEDCDAGRFNCPVRGETCACGVVFFIRYLDDSTRRHRKRWSNWVARLRR
jgi:GNAT superfamily N-acetyltransferase